MMPRSAGRVGTYAVAVLVAGFVFAAGDMHAQVSIPNIQNPINKAKAAAAKTSDQIRNAEKVGGSDSKVTNTQGQAAAAQSADRQKSAGAAAQAAAQKAAPKAGARPDSAAPQPAGRQNTVAIYREVFSYNDGGRRDPFISLMLSGELRPIITDLSLTGVIFDAEGKRSIALLVDASTGEAYRVRVGQTLARMKVTKIGMQDITFSIDEFGLSRSETLIIDRTKKAGAPAPRRP